LSAVAPQSEGGRRACSASGKPYPTTCPAVAPQERRRTFPDVYNPTGRSGRASWPRPGIQALPHRAQDRPGRVRDGLAGVRLEPGAPRRAEGAHRGGSRGRSGGAPAHAPGSTRAGPPQESQRRDAPRRLRDAGARLGVRDGVRRRRLRPGRAQGEGATEPRAHAQHPARHRPRPEGRARRGDRARRRQTGQRPARREGNGDAGRLRAGEADPGAEPRS
jgi:hypothetical protein